jgi:iron complex transport system permease protein
MAALTSRSATAIPCRVTAPRRNHALVPAALLGLLLPVLLVASARVGTTGAIGDLAALVRGALAMCGIGAGLGPGTQTIVELRWWHALTAAGVGASLGLSGALVQGVFRNGLASPSILGLSGGASLFAVLAILFVGGYGPRLGLDPDASTSALVCVPLAAILGALLVSFVVYRLASNRGHVSIPALLLVGIAMNTFLGGVQQLLQMIVINDWQVSRSILSWTFGTLDDRVGWHAAVVWCGYALSAAVIPFVAWELDLMQPGLEDARALGVDTDRVKVLALVAASVAAAAAVAVAGQIAFVGLIVPHVVRLLSGRSHRTLLWLSGLGGACFLLAADVASHVFFQNVALQPGVVMSLVGGPFFAWLLWTKRREIALW